MESKYGIGTIRNLSSGCKTLLNLLHHSEKVICVENCGPNVLKEIFQMDDIMIYMSRPGQVKVPASKEPHFYVLFLDVQILLFTRLLWVCYGFCVDKILIYKYRSDYRECILVTVHEDAGVRKRSDGLFEKDDRRQSDGKLV